MSLKAASSTQIVLKKRGILGNGEITIGIGGGEVQEEGGCKNGENIDEGWGN